MMQFVLDNWYLFLALIVIVFLLVMPNAMQQVHGIKNLGPTEAVLLVNRQAGIFVDVSEPAEFKTGHVPNAINAPLSGLDKGTGRLDKYKEKPVVVTARTNNVALKAATALRKRGFASVHLLAGGLSAWEKENLPLER